MNSTIAILKFHTEYELISERISDCLRRSEHLSQGNVPITSQEENSTEDEEADRSVETQEVNENSQEMAMQFGLPPPEPLDLSSLNIFENWKKFKQKYSNYEIATGINKKESATRVATLLTVIDNEAIDVFNTLTWDAEGDDTKIDKVLQKFVNQGKTSVTTDTNSSQGLKKVVKLSTNTSLC